jgi:hypothetical protein
LCCCGSIPTLPVPSFLLLPVISYFMRTMFKLTSYTYLHVPESPAEILSHQLWTPITFFSLGSFASYFGKVLRYSCIIPIRSLLLFFAHYKFFFFRTPSI